ncbi:hypothetical protein Glove_103g119 [Diversispora epigaea]|uniref:RlpA-like protein double-psi beta-barrel domain-containing protein n=1 Tax=Diversispora epigaea TaxID=1348612 RepID=A0A397JA92_9GLOM|nr:hypothetical protein Glove_103g119 [Diversispora epigaea]
MVSVFTNSQFMFFVMVIVVLMTFTIESYYSAPINNINSENESVNITKRAYTGEVTWYNVGLGACGVTNNDNECIAAIPGAQFDPYTPNGNPNRNSKCGKSIKVTRGKKSVIVKMMDRCAGCKSGDIDLSPAAFKKIGTLGEGRLKGCTWQYV